MLCHVCSIGSYWLHGKCAQIFTGDFLCVVAGEHNYPSCSLWRHAASLAVKVSDVTMKEPMWLTCRGEQCLISLPFSFDCTLPCIFSLCSAGIAVGFYGNGETSDGIHRLTYSLRHANRTVAGVQDRVSTKESKGVVWEWAGFLSTPLESGCASISAFFLLASELRDVLKFPLMERCFLQLF